MNSRTLIVILLLASIIGAGWWTYKILFPPPSTPAKKIEVPLETNFQTDILGTLEKESFLPHGTFPIDLNPTQFGRDDPFAEVSP